jgi:hypothetical protein
MENSTLIFPATQLLSTNDLILSSLNPLNPLAAHNSLLQKRFNSFSTISEDPEPVKKHFKSDFSVNSHRASQEQPILIDDSEPLSIQPMSFSQKNNFQELLQLSLFSAYLDQIQQAREVERRYSELFANFSQSLFNKGNRDSDLSTNESEIDGISNIISSPYGNKSRKISAFIDLESMEDEVIVIEKPSVKAAQAGDKTSNEQINISPDLLADLPDLLRKEQNKNARSKALKMVWSPDEKKIEEIDKVTKELEEGLSIKISNQERVCKLYSENGFSAKATVKRVVSQRSKYRFELKDKRAVVSMKSKSAKL